MRLAIIGRTLASVALVSYLIALAFELWRPGFVTHFWNPQILLILGIFGVILGLLGEPPKLRRGRVLVFFAVLIILSVYALWQSFPVSGSRLAATAALVLLIAGLALQKYPRSSA